MSRVGQSPILFSENIDVSREGNLIKAKGPLGELELKVVESIKVEIENKSIKVTNSDESQKGQAIWGTTRALINNMVMGVSKGFTKNLEIIGVGYRGALNGRKLSLNLGLSHTVELNIPDGIDVKMEGNTKLSINGADKQKIGQFASVIRSKRPPEPFKGKGIRYSDEYVVRKEGKKK
tara:strand:- start:75 stop:608 length:534 start_codon:yes stop_codon:yes gene_type:complete